MVAIVDSGIDYNHPDLAGSLWQNPGEISGNGTDDDGNGFVDDVNGYDFTTCEEFDLFTLQCKTTKSQDPDPIDQHGHGTYLAGVVAAQGNNGLGVIGVAPAAKVMAVRGSNRHGEGYITDLVEGIRYAADNGARVINLSWGYLDDEIVGGTARQLVAETVGYARSHGAVVVGAAGNDHLDPRCYLPPAVGDVLTVAALDHAGQPAGFSNFGQLIDVAAPGGDGGTSAQDADRNVLSLMSAESWITQEFWGCPACVVGGQYFRSRGTSASAAHVSGVAALLLAAYPALMPDEVGIIIEASAQDVGPVGMDLLTGYGAVDAVTALALAATGARPELAIDRVSVPVQLRLGDPLAITIQNLGSVDAVDVVVAIYDRPPTQGGVPIGAPLIVPTLPAFTSQEVTWAPAPFSILGRHPMHAAVDPADSVLELTEINNSVTAMINVHPYVLATHQVSFTEHSFLARSSGRRIVWHEPRNGDYQIFMYDMGEDGRFGTVDTGEGEFLLTPGPGHHSHPQMFGTSVVWLDSRNADTATCGTDCGWQVFLYDLGRDGRFGTMDEGEGEYLLTPQIGKFGSSLLAGRHVAWMDYGTLFDETIFVYDFGLDGIPGTGDFAEGLYQLDPPAEPENSAALALGESFLVWLETRNSLDEVFLYDLGDDGILGTMDTGEGEHQVTHWPTDTDPTWTCFRGRPFIAGRYIIWEQSIEDADWVAQSAVIRAYDLGPDERYGTADDGGEFDVLDRLAVNAGNMVASRGRIAWSTWRARNFDVVLLDLGADGIINTSDDFTVELQRDLLSQTPSDFGGDFVTWWQQITSDISGTSYRVFITTLEEPANRPPVFEPFAQELVTREGVPVEFTVSATDPEGDNLRFKTTVIPAGAVFDVSQRTFSWTPGFDDAGGHPVGFEVWDTELCDIRSATVTVVNVNRPPAIHVPERVEGLENELIEVLVVATDPDNEPLTLVVAGMPDGATFDAVAGRFAWIPGLEQAGEYDVVFTASDIEVQVSRNTTIVVADAPVSPEGHGGDPGDVRVPRGCHCRQTSGPELGIVAVLGLISRRRRRSPRRA